MSRITRRTAWPGVPLVGLLLGAGAVALALVIRYGLPDSPGASPGVLPPDIAALGTSVVPLEPNGTISRDQALAVAKQEIGPQFDMGQAESYLVTITDASTAGLSDRAIWLIKVSGLSVDVPRPDVASGSPRQATVAYVYIDAFTGEWLTTAMQF